MRAVLVTVLTVLLLAVAPPAVARSGVESSRARVEGVWLDRPVPGRVLAGFHMPTRYGAGHRGVDLDAPHGTVVRASAGGKVTFAGTVVGERWVTVDHGPVRTSVGPLDRIDVRRGAWVGRGAVLGRSGAAHGRSAVHWSARVGDRYVDPLRSTAMVATLVARPGAVAARAGARPVDGRATSAVPSDAPGAVHRAFARFR